jgi:HSP20 family protein
MFERTRSKDAAPLALPRFTEFGRVDPWMELNRVRTEMDPLFRAIFGLTPRLVEGTSVFAPPVDLYQTTEELVLRAYLPGVSSEDVHLEVVGDTIHLWGETKPITPEKGVTIHLSGGCYGPFDLRYALPVEIQTKRCTANYRGGILEVHLPKVETAQPHPVEIRVEG